MASGVPYHRSGDARLAIYSGYRASGVHNARPLYFGVIHPALAVHSMTARRIATVSRALLEITHQDAQPEHPKGYRSSSPGPPRTNSLSKQQLVFFAPSYSTRPLRSSSCGRYTPTEREQHRQYLLRWGKNLPERAMDLDGFISYAFSERTRQTDI